MRINPHGSITQVYLPGASVSLPPDALLLKGRSVEDRHNLSGISDDTVSFSLLEEDYVSVSIQDKDDHDVGSLNLRQVSSIDDFFQSTGKDTILIDVTSLATNIWFPLLRRALRCFSKAYAIYSEPSDYSKDPTALGNNHYDLSERISGIRPIPGTSTLSTEFDDDFVFIPILGFEGPRFAYILEEVQPPKDRTVPIVGLPGFRSEYPTKTLLANRYPLSNSGGYKHCRYASANCPFDVYDTLKAIAEDHDEMLIKIAPIGTKPAALGAALFYVKQSAQIELIFDHPVKKPGRTSGVGKTYLYNLSSFMR